MLSGREQELAGRLREAASQGDTSLVLTLLEDGAPFVVDSDGQTALHQAASAGHGETVAALILGGCDVSLQDFTGHTALQRAAAEGHVDIVKQLVKQGASVDHQDEVHGNTALHEAAWKGFSQTVTILCKAKANFYIKNRGGFAPLHLCCQNGHNETCRVLLLNGCKPDIKNNYGDTPLHTSARYGHAGVIRILVSARCNASEQNKNGDTALHIAAAMGRRKLTKILLESGCDAESKNKQGETSMEISRRKNLVDIINILQNPPPLLSQEDRQDQADNAGRAKGEKKREKTSTSSKENFEQNNNNGTKREKKRSRQSKERRGAIGPDDSAEWSPYGCHYQPDLEEFPLPKMDTLPDDPLKAGEQYFLDLGGNIKKGPTSKSSSCYCGPAFQKFEKKLEKDKQELLKHIDNSHSKLDNKISHLERKTRDQLFNLNQTMKESFASERSECLDRMDRRALRERIAIERQQAVRDVSLKRDLAGWLDKKLEEIEVRHVGSDASNAALLRSLALRDGGDLRQGGQHRRDYESEGRLRRSMSEELLSDVGLGEGSAPPPGSLYKGLRVSDQPSASLLSPGRVRRNSAGDEVAPGGRHQEHQHQRQQHNTSKSNGHNNNSLDVCSGNESHELSYGDLQYSTHSESTVQYSERDSDHGSNGVTRGGGVVANGGGVGLGSRERLAPPSSSSESIGTMAAHAVGLPLRQKSDLRQRPGLIRPQPMYHGDSGGQYNGGTDGSNTSQSQQQQQQQQQQQAQQQYNGQHQQQQTGLGYQPQVAMPPIRRFSTEADIHHAAPLQLEEQGPSSSLSFREENPPERGYREEQQALNTALPPYRAPPHLYHPRDRLARPGPLLPPVDEDEYLPLEQEDQQDLHRQLLNLPLHSSGGSHDSHNDSGYSTRLGASAGPSPSLSGSTDGENQQVGHQGGHQQQQGGGHHPDQGHLAFHHQGQKGQQGQGEGGHHQAEGTGAQANGVGPRIRALQHQLRMADINDGKGSLV